MARSDNNSFVTTPNRTPRAIGFFLLLLAVFATDPRGLRAQVAGGTISGEVTDSSGAAVDGAQVKVVDVSTNATVTVTTSGAGNFNVPDLNPGNYEVTITGTGFTPFKFRALVEVSKDTHIKAPLAVEGSTQQVQVEGSVTPTVDVESASLSQVVDGKTTREMPLNGRDWTMLSVLEPNVHTVDNQISISAGDNSRANRGVGTQITIGGTRPQQNAYRLDGIITNDYSGAGPGGALGATLGVDAIQEFSVVTSNATAEFGRESGGTISAVTRAGGNQFHGSLYEFARNSFFDATNYFSQPGTSPLERNQFGGTISGPIKRNKLFFFFNYEGIRQDQTTQQQTVAFSPNARAGYLACTQVSSGTLNSACLTGIGGTVVPYKGAGVQQVVDYNGKPGIDPAVQPYLQFFPLPTTNIVGDTGTWTFPSPASVTENLFTGRIDYTIGAKDSIHFTGLNDDSQATQPDAYDFIITGLQPDHKLYSVNEQHSVTSNLLNLARIGYSYTYVISPSGSTAINPLATQTSYGFTPGYTVGNLAIGGLTSFYGGINVEGLYSYHYNSYQAGDDIFYTHGKHTMQWGGSFEAIQSNDRGTTTGGYYQFASIATFLENEPQSFTSAVPGTNIPIYMRDKVMGFYFEDAWHALHNVTLNLGLRYEPTSNLTEAHSHFATLLLPTQSVPTTGSVLFQNPTLKNIAPRVGVAWDVFSNGKTVVHAGAGFYDTLPLPYMFLLSTLNVYPFNETLSVTAPAEGSFPQQTYLSAVNSAAPAAKLAYIQQQFGRPYVEQYLFNVQQQIAKGTSVEIGYVGATGVRQPTKSNDGDIVEPLNPNDGNPVIWPTISSTYTTNTTTGAVSAPKLTFTANKIEGSGTSPQTDTTYFNQSTSYQAFNLSFHRVTQTFRMGAAFTWAKSLDDTSSSNGGTNFSNSPTVAPFPREIGMFRGLSDFNVKLNLAINVLYNIPGPKHDGFLGAAANGWQVGGISRSATGLPFTALISGDALGLRSASTFDFPNRLYGSGCTGNPVNHGNLYNYIKTQCFAYPGGLNPVKTTSTSGSTVTTTTTYNPVFGSEQRNSLIAPGIQDIDFALVKSTSLNKLHQGAHLELRAEAFNLLNHPMFAAPARANTAIFSNVGVPAAPQTITQTSVPQRELQFGAKLVF